MAKLKNKKNMNRPSTIKKMFNQQFKSLLCLMLYTKYQDQTVLQENSAKQSRNSYPNMIWNVPETSKEALLSDTSSEASLFFISKQTRTA